MAPCTQPVTRGPRWLHWELAMQGRRDSGARPDVDVPERADRGRAPSPTASPQTRPRRSRRRRQRSRRLTPARSSGTGIAANTTIAASRRRRRRPCPRTHRDRHGYHVHDRSGLPSASYALVRCPSSSRVPLTIMPVPTCTRPGNCEGRERPVGCPPLPRLGTDPRAPARRPPQLHRRHQGRVRLPHAVDRVPVPGPRRRCPWRSRSARTR